MALVRADRILETSTTTGTGSFALLGATAGYRAFDDVCANGDTVYYAIEAVNALGVPSGDWEVGLGTFSDTDTLVRTSVLASSNAGAAVNFSAGTKRVFLTDPGDQASMRSALGLGTAAVLSTADIDERARDALGTALTAGANISITPNDGADTITIAASGFASTTQTAEMIAGFIAEPADKSYTIVLKMAHGGTITETTTKSVSGTCTATFKVNSTALGGTANSVSSSEQSQSHSGTNTFVAGDDIVLTVSSTATCVDMSFSIKYTRTLA